MHTVGLRKIHFDAEMAPKTDRRNLTNKVRFEIAKAAFGPPEECSKANPKPKVPV